MTTQNSSSEIIKIRKATQNDKLAVYDLICQLENTVFEYSLFEKFYFLNLQNPTIIYLVAELVTENEGKVIGFLSCHGQSLLHHLSIVYEIQELVVENEFKGQNIGTKLINFLEQLLLEKIEENETLFLEVVANKKRTQSHNFYKKNGFAETHFKFTKK
jgi:PhnO protein